MVGPVCADQDLDRIDYGSSDLSLVFVRARLPADQ
jgi:hypothetical protein